MVEQFPSNGYKNQKMCNHAVDDYADALTYVLHSYKAQEIGEKAVGIYPLQYNFS